MPCKYKIAGETIYLDAKRWRWTKQLVHDRDECCQICGHKKHLQVHHIHPISKGGDRYQMDNLQLVCAQCHKKLHTHNTRRK